MKILQVNKYYSPDVGGVETVCQQYTELLGSEHDVTVLAIHKSFKLFTTVENINGIKVIRCSSLGTYFSMPVSISFIFYFLWHLYRTNLAYFHLPCPLIDLAYALACFKRNVYVVWHSDIVKQKKLRKLLSPLLKYTLKRCRKILVTSPNLVKHSLFLQEYKSKCEIVPLSVNVKKIRETGGSEVVTNIFPDLTNIDALFFGRLCYYKGVETLMEAIVSLEKSGEKVNIVIAGEGEYSEHIQRVIDDNQLANVYFIRRYLTVEEKYSLLKSAKIFLFPSVEPSEAFGITQLEAMACGCPVINTLLPSGVPWVSVNGMTGLSVKPYDVIALKEAILKLVDDKKLLNEYSKNAVKRVDSLFSDEVIHSQIKNLSIID
ncbi:MAG: glycosyltransferase [Psychrobium sp.]